MFHSGKKTENVGSDYNKSFCWANLSVLERGTHLGFANPNYKQMHLLLVCSQYIFFFCLKNGNLFYKSYMKNQFYLTCRAQIQTVPFQKGIAKVKGRTFGGDFHKFLFPLKKKYMICLYRAYFACNRLLIASSHGWETEKQHCSFRHIEKNQLKGLKPLAFLTNVISASP